MSTGILSPPGINCICLSSEVVLSQIVTDYHMSSLQTLEDDQDHEGTDVSVTEISCTELIEVHETKSDDVMLHLDEMNETEKEVTVNSVSQVMFCLVEDKETDYETMNGVLSSEKKERKIETGNGVMVLHYNVEKEIDHKTLNGVMMLYVEEYKKTDNGKIINGIRREPESGQSANTDALICADWKKDKGAVSVLMSGIDRTILANVMILIFERSAVQHKEVSVNDAKVLLVLATGDDRTTGGTNLGWLCFTATYG